MFIGPPDLRADAATISVARRGELRFDRLCSPAPGNHNCRIFAVDGDTAHDKNADYQANGGDL
jgi:hypothetical protein